MRRWCISKKITAGFSFVIIGAAEATVLLFVAMDRASRSLHDGVSLTVESAMPAANLANAFEREILNARIQFIYVVTL